MNYLAIVGFTNMLNAVHPSEFPLQPSALLAKVEVVEVEVMSGVALVEGLTSQWDRSLPASKVHLATKLRCTLPRRSDSLQTFTSQNIGPYDGVGDLYNGKKQNH